MYRSPFVFILFEQPRNIFISFNKNHHEPQMVSTWPPGNILISLSYQNYSPGKFQFRRPFNLSINVVLNSRERDIGAKKKKTRKKRTTRSSRLIPTWHLSSIGAGQTKLIPACSMDKSNSRREHKGVNSLFIGV